jgi:DNA-binding IclR family transcriptional regulator
VSQSLGRALELLVALQDGPAGLDALAVRLDVHKSTVLRLLQTMEAQRFVRHDSQHRYELGSRLFELANTALAGRDVRATARSHLEVLNRATGQTVHLAAYESGQAVYIDKLDAVQGVRMYSRIGLSAPLHCTAVGKVLVAGRPETEWRAIAERIEYTPCTGATIATAGEYLVELRRVSSAGFAEDHEEHEAFINCIAAPIRDGRGDVVAAVSLSVPTISLDHEHVLELLPTLQEAAAGASAELGWQPTTARGTTRAPIERTT